jgi:hypothetical protein
MTIKYLIPVLFVLLASVLMGGCATSEEKAAREAELAKRVYAALAEKQFKIAVNTMVPHRGISQNVSFGYSVEVRNDSLISYLPYFGEVFHVPYGGGKGLNFSERIGSYMESQMKKGRRHIEIGVKNDEDTYLYTIDVYANGSSMIDVQARQRERISYSGQMTFN